jgi:predicted amidohydrolase YtcJ
VRAFTRSRPRRIAWLSQPCAKAPRGQEYGCFGNAATADQQAIACVDKALAGGRQLPTHVNGDAAIDALMKAVRAAGKMQGKSERRPLAIHAPTARGMPGGLHARAWS